MPGSVWSSTIQLSTNRWRLDFTIIYSLGLDCLFAKAKKYIQINVDNCKSFYYILKKRNNWLKATVFESLMFCWVWCHRLNVTKNVFYTSTIVARQYLTVKPCIWCVWCVNAIQHWNNYSIYIRENWAGQYRLYWPAGCLTMLYAKSH